MKLRDVAHSRTGDKGNTSNISVIAYRAEDFPRIREFVTAERVRAQLAGLTPSQPARGWSPLPAQLARSYGACRQDAPLSPAARESDASPFRQAHR